jgi:peptidoglycan hydrolase-like protein with peptidoglycan-binding domain
MGSAAHKRQRDESSRVGWLIGALVVVLVAVVAGGTLLALHAHTSSSPSASATNDPNVTPLAVLGTTPAAKATNIASDTEITVDLSTGLAPGSALPVFSPPVAGTWTAASSNVLQFVADGPLTPGAHETMTLPGGPTGMLASDGNRLPSTVTVEFTVAPGTTLRLQQLLAELGYLPVSFVPTTQLTSPQQEADPQQGTFAWRWSGLPAALTSQWTPGTYGVVTKGAVMAFETQHGLTHTGQAGPQTWSALLAAALAEQGDSQPYDYVSVSKTSPETVSVYQNGSVAYSTLANTGVAAAPTATGTFPVFEHVVSTTMTGTNPTGSHYVDPNIPWVSYFNGGDALHGYVRGSYGFPQSDGCVEMPPSNAAVVYPMTPIGTLVTVA